jgi:DNA-binding NarL/FixJ family response regulator
MMATTLLLADDHELVLAGVRHALADHDDMQVVGEAHTGSQVMPLINRLNPDVVLLDIRMPGIDGLQLVELIKRKHPHVKVIFLSVYHDTEHVRAGLGRGADGYIAKSVNPADLAGAIRQAIEGTVFTPLAGDTSSQTTSHELTAREVTILRCISRGESNAKIARDLWLTEGTIKFHLTNVYRKLGVSNRTSASRAAYRLGIAESPIIDQ